MAKNAGLPWDCVFSAELFRQYKPDPETYLGAAGLLGLKAAACRGHAASVRALTRNVSSLVSAIEWSSTTEELR